MNWNKVAKWALVNFSVMALFIVGETTGTEWASNIAVFVLWITVVVPFVMMFALDDMVELTLKKEPDYEFSVPQWLDVTFDIIMLGMLVGFGYFFLAVGYILHILVLAIFRDKLTEAQASTPEPMETS